MNPRLFHSDFASFATALFLLLAIPNLPLQAASGQEQLQFVNQVRSMLDAGTETLKKGDLEGAIRQWQSLRQWARSQPHMEWYSMTNEALALRYIADALMEARRYDEAIAEAKMGLDILLTHPFSNDPAAADSKNNVGFSLRGTIAMSHERSGRYQEAMAMLEEISRTYQGDLTSVNNAMARVKEALAASEAGFARMAQVREQAIKRAEEAEARGNRAEALGIYAAAMQALLPGFSPQLAEKAVDLVKRTKPLPPIPEEARRYAVYGQTALKTAKEQKDFLAAAQQYWHALALAPWWAELYLNLGLTFELMGDNQGALNMLKSYSLLAPPAEAGKVRDKIYELEYKTKQTGR